METQQSTGNDPPYGSTVHLRGSSLAEARARVTEALKTQGFGVLTEIDMQATLRQKLGAELAPYVVLGACNPQLAQRALAEELGVGLLLPCNVCLWQEREGTAVSIVDPRALFKVVDNPRLQPIVDEVERRLGAVVAALRA
jgi:uncharacterized protein (DUF302 family)